MIRLSFITVLSLAACAPTDGFEAAEIAGVYTRECVDTWDELEIRADGKCVWWLCSAAFLFRRDPFQGRWRRAGDQIILEIDTAGDQSRVGEPVLHLRRWREHVYLVPTNDVEWFDTHGPMVEFCFHTDDAPLLPGPPGVDSLQFGAPK